jgi:hypothetical protein
MCIIQVPYHGVSFGCPDFVELLEIGEKDFEDQKDNFQKTLKYPKMSSHRELLGFSIGWEQEAT